MWGGTARNTSGFFGPAEKIPGRPRRPLRRGAMRGIDGPSAPGLPGPGPEGAFGIASVLRRYRVGALIG
jgi:hypothetical protein